MLYKETKTPKLLLTSSAIALVLMMNGCSDDKRSTQTTSSTTTTEAPIALKFNNPPTANAGSDLIVSVGEVVTLNGTQSADSDNDLMTFSWSQDSGESVEILNADTLTPSFVAPASKQPLTFSLIVSDGQDESTPDIVSVAISNRAPIASAGRTIVAKRGSNVTLDGSNSIDADNDKIAYSWKQVYGEVVALHNANTNSPSFTMPSTSGYLVFALSVNDGTDESIADTVAVKVTNTPPVARAGSIAGNIIAGKTIQLDGSNSTDADGDALNYKWKQTLGTPVLVEGSNTATPRFTAPQRPDHLVFELTVNDGEITSHPDSLIVSVKNEVKQLEEKADLNKIVKAEQAEGLKPKKSDKNILDVAALPELVENFLPEIAKTFVAPVAAAADEHHGSTKSHAEHKAHWSYEGEGSPENWAHLDEKFEVCGSGKFQSPIDIQTTELSKSDREIKLNYQPSAINVVNNGHTIQANYDSGSYAEIDGKRYDLLQFHFHSPSEHKIDSKPADMVAHLVHKAEDGELAVIGILFKEGHENKFLKPIWENLPQKSGGKVSSSSAIVASNMLPNSTKHYHYTGSLTTPPCSEGVNWNVLATTVEASPEQIRAFTSIFEKSVRPVQPIFDRMVSID